MKLLHLCSALTALLASSPLSAQEWTRFRGPNGSGISSAKTVPTKWTTDDFNWKVPLPGVGYGSPVIWGNRLFVQCDDKKGAKRIVLCVDTQTGKTLWKKTYDSKTHRKHRKNSYASSTPTVDSEHVYFCWATPGKLSLRAFSHDGKEAWDTDLGPFKGGHGFAGSPIVYKDSIILANDQDGKSSLISVNKKTGKVQWNVPRNSLRITYSTPCIYERAGRPAELIFTNWKHGITGVDPQTGKTNWELSVFDQSHKERAIGSPVVSGELVIGTCGFVTAQKHVVAVRPGDPAKPSDVKEVFRIEKAVPHIPTVLVYEKRLYLWSDKGIVTCCDAITGKQIWQRRVGGNFFGSPVCVAGRLMSISNKGEMIVLATGDTYKLLAKNSLGVPCQCTPAIANGRLFIRTESHLISIGGPEE
jgi:outer membrane protein assembly factor BamB